MAFVKRAIDVSFEYGQGDFGQNPPPSGQTAPTGPRPSGNPGDVVTLSGLRVSALIQEAGGASFSTAQIAIGGMPLSLMHRLSTLGKANDNRIRDNLVTITAGEAGGTKSIVFKGTLLEAWSDLSQSPNATFNVTAYAGMIAAMKPVPAGSFRGATDVAEIMSGLATLMGYTLENSGVNGLVLSNPYFPGTAREQAIRCAEAAHIEIFFDEKEQKLAIYPKDGSRNAAVPVISSSTGMVGYPAYAPTGIDILMEYNPSVVFGGTVQVESTIVPARGKWVVNALVHDLSSETPGGPWFTSIKGYVFGRPPTVA